ncbi:hypothetical protein ACIPN8_24795 [Streptomyces sp. NPDC086082]
MSCHSQTGSTSIALPSRRRWPS